VHLSIGAEPLTPTLFNCGRIVLALRSESFRSLDENIHPILKYTRYFVVAFGDHKFHVIMKDHNLSGQFASDFSILQPG
jgi:hypothetical protein